MDLWACCLGAGTRRVGGRRPTSVGRSGLCEGANLLSRGWTDFQMGLSAGLAVLATCIRGCLWPPATDGQSIHSL